MGSTAQRPQQPHYGGSAFAAAWAQGRLSYGAGADAWPRGILPDQESTRVSHWQAGSSSLSHQGSLAVVTLRRVPGKLGGFPVSFSCLALVDQVWTGKSK